MSDPKLTIEQEAANFWVKYFCVCGEWEKSLDAFREIMRVFSPDDHGHCRMDGQARDAYIEKHGQGLTHCILYWLDAMGLAEHGTSINWSWLTPLGAHVRNEVLNGTPDLFCHEDDYK